MILSAIAINTLYQFWIHTELIDRIGPLEHVLNTASHHRVHHGANLEYLDRNHAGMFIVWDKLFGTFAPERARGALRPDHEHRHVQPGAASPARVGRDRPRRAPRHELARRVSATCSARRAGAPTARALTTRQLQAAALA